MKKIAGIVLVLALAPLAAFADSTVTTTADQGSSISPSGVVVVPPGIDQTFFIGVDNHFTLSDVQIDGASQGAVSSVDFTGVAADPTNHSINVFSVADAPTGGTMPFCSGPMAPGWDVSLPGGGCAGHTEMLYRYNQPMPDGTVCEFFSGCMVR